ncbi:MAG: HisA/HisF-related TIM barrel protein, partial [Candidatus Omnitrophota bacterium]
MTDIRQKPNFTIFPAIDIRGGKCVRLIQGDYERQTTYSDSPAAQAVLWEKQGAEFLHLVDLDGAKEGKPVNLDSIAAITKAVKIPCELGGGIRTIEDAELVFRSGIERIIVGTAVCENPELIEAMLRNPLFKELIGAADKKRNLRLAQQLRRMIEDRQTLWGSQRLSGMTEEQIMRQISDTEGLKRGIKLYDSADSDQEQAWRGLRDVIESALKRMQDEIRRRNLMPHGDKLYLIQAICLADEGEAVQAVALLGQKQQPRISIERARTFLGIWNDKKSREAALLALRLAYPEARRILDGDETRFVGPRMRMFDAENTWYTPQLRKDLEYLASLGGSRMASERSYPFKHVSTMGQLNQNGRQGNEYLSYLNRYRNQWGWINENYLPAMTRRNGEKREASVVSLGSSTGEELLRSFYQVGTYLDEADSGVNKWRVRADGYDRDPEICREGNLRIQGKKPFVGDLKASQDPYARDLIRYLNHHRRQAQAGMSLTAQDVLSVDRIRRQQPGADIVLVNHMIRNLPEASRQGFLRDVTRAWPDALVVVTDFPKDVDQATLTAQREVETQAADNPGDTSYFVLPRWLSHQSVTAARMSATPVRESREGVFNLPAAVESLARGLIARVGAQGVERLLEVLKEAETNPEAPKVAADLPTAFTYWSRHGRNEDFWPQLYLAVVYENQKIQAASPEGLLALLTGKIRDMEVVVAGIADAMEAAGVGGLTNEELGQAGTGYEQRLKGRVLEKIPDLKVSIKKAESACPNGYFDRLKQRMSDLEAKISASQMLGILRQERERRLYFKDKPWDGQIVFAVAGAGSVWSRDIWMSPRVAWQFLAQKRTDGFDLVRRVRELIEAQSGRV